MSFRTIPKAESACLFLEYILCDEHYCSPDHISYILIMFTNKSEFTKCLAPEETAVSRDPQTSPSGCARRGVSAAGPWAVLPLRHSQVGLGPRAGLPRTQAEPLCGGWPVGVPQHGVKGPGEVVGLRAAVVLLGGGQQAGQEQQQQEQQLQGQCRPEHPGQEGALRPRAAWVSRARHPGNREGGELSRRPGGRTQSRFPIACSCK